jgi:hypothetical protein
MNAQRVYILTNLFVEISYFGQFELIMGLYWI